MSGYVGSQGQSDFVLEQKLVEKKKKYEKSAKNTDLGIICAKKKELTCKGKFVDLGLLPVAANKNEVMVALWRVQQRRSKVGAPPRSDDLVLIGVLRNTFHRQDEDAGFQQVVARVRLHLVFVVQKVVQTLPENIDDDIVFLDLVAVVSHTL